jgi:adenylate cyclase
VGPEDKILPIDEELRVQAVSPPPAVAALLSSPLLQGLDAQNPSREGALAVQGESWLATLSPLSIAGGGTAGWFVAVLVPETFYTHDLWQLARGLGVVFTVCLVLVLAIGGGALTVARRGVQSALRRTARMREFDFEPNAQSSRLSDVDALLLGIERAKTAARAMCKYIPVPLVRGLFERNHEPELGGEAREVSLLFSDLQGFTALSERLAPDQLATLLGHYFEVVTDALEQSGATIDKYIGDAVMAFWNAPADVADHSAAACRGVLACQAALRELYASDKWQALPPLVTRFGLHRATVLVGHFGSPTRLAYTAIGDGVNLASRLEGACKQYDVTVLASADFVAASEKHFEYRRLDSLTVRGKTRAIDVYELLGPRS